MTKEFDVEVREFLEKLDTMTKVCDPEEGEVFGEAIDIITRLEKACQNACKPAVSMGMNFSGLAKANLERCEKHFHPLNDWSPSDWSNAMAGECGEVCNLTKKLRRGEFIAPEEIGREIADTVIYADLLAQRMKLSLGKLVRDTFNNKSDEKGCTIKL